MRQGRDSILNPIVMASGYYYESRHGRDFVRRFGSPFQIESDHGFRREDYHQLAGLEFLIRLMPEMISTPDGADGAG